MFWIKSDTSNILTGVSDKVGSEAERLYRSGKMHCAEAVLEAVRTTFLPASPAEMVALAAGFGGGSGAGCICGAVAGGTMALGLVLHGDRKQAAQATRELQRWFREEYGATCCKLLTTAGKKGCPLLTGRVAGKVAELLEERLPADAGVP